MLVSEKYFLSGGMKDTRLRERQMYRIELFVFVFCVCRCEGCLSTEEVRGSGLWQESRFLSVCDSGAAVFNHMTDQSFEIRKGKPGNFTIQSTTQTLFYSLVLQTPENKSGLLLKILFTFCLNNPKGRCQRKADKLICHSTTQVTLLCKRSQSRLNESFSDGLSL